MDTFNGKPLTAAQHNTFVHQFNQCKSFTKKKGLLHKFLKEICPIYFSINVHKKKKENMPSKLMYNLIIKQEFNFRGIKMNFIAYFCKYNLKKFLIFTLEELIPKCLGEGIGVKENFVKGKIKNILEIPNDCGYTNYMLAGQNISILQILWDKGARNLLEVTTSGYDTFEVLLFSKYQSRKFDDLNRLYVNTRNNFYSKKMKEEVRHLLDVVKFIFKRLSYAERIEVNKRIPEYFKKYNKHPYYKSIFIWILANAKIFCNSYPVKMTLDKVLLDDRIIFEVRKLLFLPIGLEHNSHEVYKLLEFKDGKSEAKQMYLWLSYKENKFSWIISEMIGNLDSSILKSDETSNFLDLKGCKEWHQESLKISADIVEITQEYNFCAYYLTSFEGVDEISLRMSFYLSELLSHLYYSKNIETFVKELYFSKSYFNRSLLNDFYNKYKCVINESSCREEIKSVFDWPSVLIPIEYRNFISLMSKTQINRLPVDCKSKILDYLVSANFVCNNPIPFKYTIPENGGLDLIQFKHSDILNCCKYKIKNICRAYISCVISKISLKIYGKGLYNLIKNYINKKIEIKKFLQLENTARTFMSMKELKELENIKKMDIFYLQENGDFPLYIPMGVVREDKQQVEQNDVAQEDEQQQSQQEQNDVENREEIEAEDFVMQNDADNKSDLSNYALLFGIYALLFGMYTVLYIVIRF
tara:strand:- start:818 stop:2911 length:2094 start_codon:yes stop_codon:yes gene_type:complete